MGWVDDIANGLVELYGTRDPFDLCDFLNIRLMKMDPDCAFLRYHDCLYTKYDNGDKVILYRAGLRYKRLKFYLLHEIGHAILHPGVRYSFLVNNHKLEYQADYFALKLHLPSDPEYYVNKPIQHIAIENDIPKNVLRIGQ